MPGSASSYNKRYNNQNEPTTKDDKKEKVGFGGLENLFSDMEKELNKRGVKTKRKKDPSGTSVLEVVGDKDE